MQKKDFNIESPNKWLKPFPWLIIFIITATVKTWLAFKGEALLGKNSFPVLLFTHKLVVFSGLVAAWFGCDALVKKFMNYNWFVWLSGFSFIIYALHTPILFYANAVLMQLLQHVANYRILIFITLPIAIIIFCISLGALLRKIAPKFYGILTGGRGL